MTDAGREGYYPRPRAVTCSVCGQDIPPDKNMLVLAVPWDYGTFKPGQPLCIPCVRTEGSKPLRWDLVPWNTSGARKAGRTMEEYQHWCDHCERPFYGALARRHCSDECGEAIRASRRDRSRDVYPRPCDVCGELFTPPRSDGRYCKPACRQKAYRRRNGGG